MVERKGITELVGKTISHAETVYRPSGKFYRLFMKGGGCINVNSDWTFDEDGMFFEDDVRVK